MQGVLDFDNSSGSGDDDYIPQHATAMGWDMQDASQQMQARPQPYSNIGTYGTPPHSAPMQQQDFNFSCINAMPVSASHSFSDSSTLFGLQQDQALPPSNNNWLGDQYPGSDLSDILGELKIGENGVGK